MGKANLTQQLINGLHFHANGVESILSCLPGLQF